MEKLEIALKLCDAVGKFNAAQKKYLASITVSDLGADGYIQFWIQLNNPEFPVETHFMVTDCSDMWRAIGIMRHKEAEQDGS